MGLLISPWAYSRIKSKFLKISFANKPMGLFAKFLISNDFKPLEIKNLANKPMGVFASLYGN